MWRRGKVIKRHQRGGRKKKGILKRKEEGKQPFPIDTMTALQRAALKPGTEQLSRASLLRAHQGLREHSGAAGFVFQP